jgi:ribosomal protein S18 acetylase RimI-like enzyme
VTNMNKPIIVCYSSKYRESLLELVVSAWEPVFVKTRKDVLGFVYDNFWPQGWQIRQVAEVSTLLDTEPEKVWIAIQNNELAGFVVISIHPQDQMGEVSIIAVSPTYQRQGVGNSLMQFAEQHIRAAGMKMVMVETVGDSGHEPARRIYEALGYENWPVARYFKQL